MTTNALSAMYEVVWHDTSSVSDDDRIRRATWLNDAQIIIIALTNEING